MEVQGFEVSHNTKNQSIIKEVHRIDCEKSSSWVSTKARGIGLAEQILPNSNLEDFFCNGGGGVWR